MKKLFMNVGLFLALGLLMSSCMVTKTQVGTYRQETGKEYKYAQGKQVWVFWGLVPCGRTEVSTPTDGSCMIRTGYTFGDIVVSALTGGIVSTYTIRVFDKKDSE